MSTATTPTCAHRARPGRCSALLLSVLGALVMFQGRDAAGGEPQVQMPLEQAVKAAYVYNFTKFVSWPAESPFTRAPALTIGILGDDSFADAVETTVRGKHVEGRPLTVRRFRTAGEVAPCAVLFVARRMVDRVPQLLQRLGGWPVLTVSDAEGFTSQGGMIELFREDNRIHFQVGLTAARTAGLSVSSKLLRLSRPARGRACATCASGSAEER